MLKQKIIRKIIIASFLLLWVEVQQCNSVTTYSTIPTHIPKINGAKHFQNHQNHPTTNNITNAFEKDSIKEVQEYVVCEILSRNLTWENASCNESLIGNNVVCLSSNNGCVNLDDKVHPCNMTCLHEYKRMFAQCPVLSEKTKESIKLAKFLLDGVLKVK